MSPAMNRDSAIGDSHLHSQGTPAPLGMFGPSTPMTPHTPASADPGIVPQLQLNPKLLFTFLIYNKTVLNLIFVGILSLPLTWAANWI